VSTNIFALVLATMFLAAVPSAEAQYVGKSLGLVCSYTERSRAIRRLRDSSKRFASSDMSRDEPSILNTDLRKERASVFLS